MAAEGESSAKIPPLLEAIKDPLDAFYFGKIEILGDVMASLVPYEDYTFDAENFCPEEWVAKQAAANQKV